MVAVIKPNQHLRATFYYNENKQKSGQAVCLLAENYPRQLSALTELNKLAMLQKMAELRPRVKLNSLHISLNFDPSENLSADQLSAIARDYMEGIGFGNQPYLVYQHFDAGHPHLHLLTTNIQADGKPISLHHLGIRASEPTRKMIEEKYGLFRAEEQGRAEYQLRPVAVEKAVYGKSQTKRAIGNILQSVLQSYRYATLPELNALLGLYNIRAERGSENSRIYQHRGLVYRLLDSDGKVTGVPVKASLYAWKPGLNYLEGQFKVNLSLKLPFRRPLKNAVDLALLSADVTTMEALVLTLKKQGIDLVIHQNPACLIYGCSYVDHQRKCVFKGSELGKKYSAKGIQDRLQQSGVRTANANLVGLIVPDSRAGMGILESPIAMGSPDQQHPPESVATGGIGGLIELLLQPEATFEPDPFDLTRRRKKRKKRNHVKPE